MGCSQVADKCEKAVFVRLQLWGCSTWFRQTYSSFCLGATHWKPETQQNSLPSLSLELEIQR